MALAQHHNCFDSWPSNILTQFLLENLLKTHQNQSDWRTPCDVPKLTIIEIQNPFTIIESISGEGHQDSGLNKEHEGIERGSLRG